MLKLLDMKKGFMSALLIGSISVSGCSTISDMWADEEEIEAKKLDPINAVFEPVVLWQEQIGYGVGDYYSRLKPAVGYNMVFAASRQGKVRAYEQQSGKQIWEQDFSTYNDEGYMSGVSRLWSDGQSARIAGGLNLAYENLFFGTENGDVYALNAKSGEVLWHAKVKGEVLSAPAVDEGVVVINTGAGLMYALDAATGEQKWSYETEVPPLSLRGVSAPSINNGGAIMGTASGKLVVTLIDSGNVAWEQTVGTPTGSTELDRIVDIDSKPLILGGVIYGISFEGTLAAVELRSGRVIWKREYKSYRRISIDGNSLFVVDNNSVVYALDRRNGVELWSQNGLRHRLATAAEPVSDYIVVGDKYGFLHWMNQSDGKMVARLEVGANDEDESIYTAPVADGNIIYSQTQDGQLVAIETP